MRARLERRLLRTAVILIVAAGIGYGLWTWRGQAAGATAPIAGMVRQTEIRIAPDTTGRLASVEVASGQQVRKGDLLAVLDNPDLAAAVEEAKAAAASARADRDRVYSGVRAEQVSIARQAVETAQATLLLAQQQNARTATLAGKGFTSRQKLDESNASLAKARLDLDLKQAQLTAAQAGPTAEERALADAKVARAEASVADLQAQLDKTRLIAPIDGTIGIRVAEPGEIIGPGKPVVTLRIDGQRWFAFTVREDRLPGITPGGSVALTGPDGRRIDARVTVLRPLGEFATWRAARAIGDHDLNSFQMRLDPEGGIDGLEPGMTVWLTGAS